MSSKLLLSKLFIENFKDIYNAFCEETNYDVPFEKVFEDNEKRLEFLNLVMQQINSDKMSSKFVNLFADSINFVSGYINGDYKCGVEVPYVYKEDINGCYIPTADQLKFLFKMINICCSFHEKMYYEKSYTIELPSNTLNQRIHKIFSIGKENLPHILGLTEASQKGNYLFKYFLEMDKKNNPDLYTTEVGQPLSNGERVSERYLNWILSEDGQNKIIEINELIRGLMDDDMKNNPQDYVNGQPKSPQKFATLVKSQLNIDFPFLNFSRYVCKTINLFNFLNMNNTSEMIVDYKPVVQDGNPCDFFLVNSPNEVLETDGIAYINMKDYVIYCVWLLSSGNSEEVAMAKEALHDFGIKIDFNNPDSIGSLSNLLFTDKFVGRHGIKPNLSGTNFSIMMRLAKHFGLDVHLLGFSSNVEEGMELGIDQTDIFSMDCRSSMVVAVPEYLDNFNVRGRCFYFDILGSGTRVGFVNSVDDEIRHLKRKQILGFDSQDRIDRLVALRRQFNNGCGNFKQSARSLLDDDSGVRKVDEDSRVIEVLNTEMNEVIKKLNSGVGDNPISNKKI